MSNAIKIHRFPLSGHCHRVELFSSLTGINYELVEVDLVALERRRLGVLRLPLKAPLVPGAPGRVEICARDTEIPCWGHTTRIPGHAAIWPPQPGRPSSPDQSPA